LVECYVVISYFNLEVSSSFHTARWSRASAREIPRQVLRPPPWSYQDWLGESAQAMSTSLDEPLVSRPWLPPQVPRSEARVVVTTV
jgi:hypothetical protein